MGELVNCRFWRISEPFQQVRRDGARLSLFPASW